MAPRKGDPDSGRDNKVGIDAVGNVVCGFMASHHIPVGNPRATKSRRLLESSCDWDGPADNAGGNIALVAHRDTVFPERKTRPSIVQHPRWRRRTRAIG
jgi:hypothetical protein